MLKKELRDFKINHIAFVSCKTGENIKELKNTLVDICYDKKLVGELVNKSWIKLSEDLNRLRKKNIIFQNENQKARAYWDQVLMMM